MLTMGKAMMHGVVPFKDIFEQRGLYMYVLHWVGILPQPSHWLWIIEMINFYLIYQLLIKIFKLQSSKYTTWKACITLITLQFASCFNQGASPEEFMLLPNIYAIYLMLKHYDGLTTVSNRERFLLALGLAFIFNVKYSNIGIIGVFLIFDLIINRYKFISVIRIDICGFIVGWLPIIIYFGSHNYLLQFFHTYFIENAKSTSIKSFSNWTIKYLTSIAANSLYIILYIMIFGVATYFVFRHVSRSIKLLISISFIIELLCISLIMRVGLSYSLSLQMMIIILGCYGSPYLIHSFLHKRWKWYQICLLIYPITIALLLNIVIFSSHIKNSIFAIRILPISMYHTLNQRHIGDINQSKLINKHNNGLILSYGYIPTNIYLYNKSYPTQKIRYFDQTTIPYSSQPQAANSQYQYINNQTPKWISMTIPDITVKSYSQYASYLSQKPLKNTIMNNIAASITATQERISHHKNQYVIGLIKKDTNYTVCYIPKTLLHHYTLISIQNNHDSSLNDDSYSTYQLLFLRKSDLKKYPDLSKKSIDIEKIKKVIPK